jgi:hypothetical protein
MPHSHQPTSFSFSPPCTHKMTKTLFSFVICKFQSTWPFTHKRIFFKLSFIRTYRFCHLIKDQERISPEQMLRTILIFVVLPQLFLCISRKKKTKWQKGNEKLMERKKIITDSHSSYSSHDFLTTPSGSGEYQTSTRHEAKCIPQILTSINL